MLSGLGSEPSKVYKIVTSGSKCVNSNRTASLKKPEIFEKTGGSTGSVSSILAWLGVGFTKI